MPFKNPNNRCSLSGYVSNICEYTPGAKSIELDIVVERPSYIKGGKSFSDLIRIYISDPVLLKFVSSSVKKGSIINAKGELRSWIDGSYKIAAYELTMKG